MNARTILMSSVLLVALAAPLLARDKDDVLIMKNGDHLTCRVKGLAEGVLFVSFDYIDGTTSLQWSKVARLETKQLFIVHTADGLVYTGTLRTADTPAGEPVKIEVVQVPEKAVVLDRSQIVKMGETSEAVWKRFNGEISSGINYSKGNQAVQYNIASDVEYLRERWSANANFSSSLASSTGASASTRNDLQFGAERLLRWNNYFYAGFANFLQSTEQGIDVQTSFGGGVGRYLKNSNHAVVSVLGGFTWQRTNYDQSIGTQGPQDLATGLIAANAKFFRFSKTNLNVSAVLFPAISEPGRVRFNTNAAYFVKLFSNLSWNVTFYGSWDNRPPPNFSGSDYGTSSGLSWTFGLR